VQRCRHEVRIRFGEQQVRDVRRREGQPPVDARQRPAPGPGHLTGRGQLVEQRRRIAGQARRQDERLERARRQRGPGELLDHAQDVVDAGRAPHPPAPATRSGLHPLPRRQEPAERPLLHRLDLGPQPGERGSPQPPQHLRVAVLGAVAGPGGERGGPQLTTDQPAGPDHPVQHAGDHGDPQAEPGRRLGRPERAARAGVAEQQVAQRIRHRLGERLGHADGQWYAERVADPTGVLDRAPPLLAGDADPDHPPHRLQVGEPLRCDATVARLGGGQRPEEPQQVCRALGVAGMPVGGEPLQRPLDLDDHLGIEQLPDRLGAEQLGQQRRVQRQRGGAPLGERRVGLVEEHPHIAEQQAARER
jgi:hypothetical protein